MSSIPSTSKPKQSGVTIRPVREEDLPTADRIIRLAFGTFLGVPDPSKFMGDVDYARTRWLADPSAVFGAELAGELVGTNFATRWGSVGFFGPLTIRPDLWDRGIAQLLLAPTMDLFERWGIRHAGLFTFANSPKHVSLYQKFGFWPRFLTAIMELPVGEERKSVQWTCFGEFSPDEKQSCLQACREVTSSNYEGLDVEREIRAVDNKWRYDWRKRVCMKFGSMQATRPVNSGDCSTHAASSPPRVVLQTSKPAMNLARLDAYREMLGAGFRTFRQGVAMQRDADPGYNRPEVFLIDDWR